MQTGITAAKAGDAGMIAALAVLVIASGICLVLTSAIPLSVKKNRALE